ncbi:twin-arginine translocation signal domain-containing protein, partial [Acinetobacter baumannii]
MDISRRSLMNATAAGAAAGALAATPEPARAAPLTSTLGRDATQYGV